MERSDIILYWSRGFLVLGVVLIIVAGIIGGTIGIEDPSFGWTLGIGLISLVIGGGLYWWSGEKYLDEFTKEGTRTLKFNPPGM